MKSMITVKFAVIFFVITIILAHSFAPIEYNWKQNTISDLGAQQYKNAWIMRVGFIGFGILVCAALIRLYSSSENRNYSDLLIAIYAIGIFLTGFFSTAPFLGTSSFSIQEDKWHSVFAQVAGIAFSFGILWHLIGYSNPNQRIVNFIFLVLVIGFSSLVGLSKNELIPIGLGIFQRGLYVISFIWLLFRYQ